MRQRCRLRGIAPRSCALGPGAGAAGSARRLLRSADVAETDAAETDAGKPVDAAPVEAARRRGAIVWIAIAAALLGLVAIALRCRASVDAASDEAAADTEGV